MLRSILKQFISKRKFRISLEKGHFRSLEKKGRGLDPQDPPRSCAPVMCDEEGAMHGYSMSRIFQIEKQEGPENAPEDTYCYMSVEESRGRMIM